jgi:hypothetical protein
VVDRNGRPVFQVFRFQRTPEGPPDAPAPDLTSRLRP